MHRTTVQYCIPITRGLTTNHNIVPFFWWAEERHQYRVFSFLFYSSRKHYSSFRLYCCFENILSAPPELATNITRLYRYSYPFYKFLSLFGHLHTVHLKDPSKCPFLVDRSFFLLENIPAVTKRHSPHNFI